MEPKPQKQIMQIMLRLLLLLSAALILTTTTTTTTAFVVDGPSPNQFQSSCSRWPTRSSSSASPTRLLMASSSSPEPLATEGDWTAYLDDESTGLIYYFNIRTGESRWVQPTPTFPDIKLPRNLKRIADRKQKEYRKAVAATKTAFSAKAVAEAAAIEEQQQKQQKEQQAKDKTEEGESWFDFLSDDGDKAEAEEEAALATTTKKEEDEGDWFSGIFGYKEKEAESQRKAQGDEDEWFGGWFTGSSGDGDDDGGKSWRISDQAKDVATSTAVAEPEEPATPVAEPKKEEVAPSPAASVVAEPAIETKEEEKVVKVVTEPEKPPPKKKKVEEEVEKVEKEPEEEEEGFLRKLFAPSAPPEVEEKKPVKEKVVAKPAVEKVVEKEKKVVEVGPVVPDISAYVLPDPKKIFWGGEDAVFVKGRTFGVFDGVSGASKLDGVPLYSKTMAQQMKNKVISSKVEELTMKDMISILGDVVEYCNEKATGATTAIVGSITEDGNLRVLNIGDSSCVVVRPDNGRVVARSKEINHFYECPYQFSETSPDRPRDGTKMNLKLKRGDIVVMGSDGIFDNLSDDEIADIVLSKQNQMKSASVLAKRISDRSRKVSFNRKAETPFSKMALQKQNPDYPTGLGGKVDDISCVVVRYE